MWHDWWLLSGWVWFVVFWGGVAFVAVWAARTFARQDGLERRPSPLDIAKERYASGEIAREEFELLKKDLSDGSDI
jgi:uncharacterized membrane protein